jgi:hypothetical protein
MQSSPNSFEQDVSGTGAFLGAENPKFGKMPRVASKCVLL